MLRPTRIFGACREYIIARDGPTRVLVIDEQAIVRASLGQALDAQGYQVDTVASVDDAVALLARRAFQVAVVDLRRAEGGYAGEVARLKGPRPAMKILDLSGDACTTTGIVDAVALLLQ